MENNIATVNSNPGNWDKIAEDLTKVELLDYKTIITDHGRQISLEIDIDLGGGFEGGYAATTFTALLHNQQDFRFAIHKEDFLDEIGKFFGMQDIVIGESDFDQKMIIKTNNEDKVKSVLADAEVRELLQSLDDFSFGITQHHVDNHEFKEPFLELEIEDGITDLNLLKRIYNAFYTVLIKIDPL